MDTIKLAIIGCGGMGTSHQASFSELQDVITVTATCDIEVEKARAMAELLGAEHYSDDYHEVLDYCDAVLLVLPHHLHFEVGMECLRAGKHVLMEKPMCNTEAQCLDLIHLAQAKQLTLMTAYPVRYLPLYRQLKEIIDQKTYGDVFQVSIWTEQYTMTNIWSKSAEKLGGGQLFSHGCHYIDCLLWYLGNPVRGFHLGTNYGTPWMEKEGTSNVSMEFENGALGYHFGTWGAKGSKLKYSVHAHFTEAMVELNVSDGLMYLHKFGEEPKLLASYEPGKNTQFEIGHFAHCIRTGEVPETNGPESLQGLRNIWRMYEAEQKGIVADLRGLGLNQEWDIPGLAKLPQR